MFYCFSGRQANQTRHQKGKRKIEEPRGEHSTLEEIFESPKHDKWKRCAQLSIVPQLVQVRDQTLTERQARLPEVTLIPYEREFEPSHKKERHHIYENYRQE